MAERASAPKELEREIERTRDELARTIDALADRVNPKNVARRGVRRVKQEAGHLVSAVGGRVTGRPSSGNPRHDRAATALLVGAGVALTATAIAIAWQQRRRR